MEVFTYKRLDEHSSGKKILSHQYSCGRRPKAELCQSCHQKSRILPPWKILRTHSCTDDPRTSFGFTNRPHYLVQALPAHGSDNTKLSGQFPDGRNDLFNVFHPLEWAHDDFGAEYSVHDHKSGEVFPRYDANQLEKIMEFIISFFESFVIPKIDGNRDFSL